MEGFRVRKNTLLNNIPSEIISEIREYSKRNPNEESCGIIYESNNKKRFLPCDNLSQDKAKYFFIDPRVFIKYKNISCIYHSHCIGSCYPSVLDKKMSKNLSLPMLIYSLLDDEFYYYNK